MSPQPLPVDSKDWYKIYGSPKERVHGLRQISAKNLSSMILHCRAGKDYLIVDVRRSDCDVSEK